MKLSWRSLVQDVLTTLGLIGLTVLFLRLWPLLLIILTAAVLALVRMLYLYHGKSEKQEEPVKALPVYRSVETESELRTAAFQILQKRITEQLSECYPEARWVWETPAPIEALAAGQNLAILLNRAGGYRRANIVIKQLQFATLVFDTIPTPQSGAEEPAEIDPVDTDEGQPTVSNTDYSFLAFHWVNENLCKLNELCNQALSKQENIVILPATMLPEVESWEAICQELEQNDLESRVEDGSIHLLLV